MLPPGRALKVLVFLTALAVPLLISFQFEFLRLPASPGSGGFRESALDLPNPNEETSTIPLEPLIHRHIAIASSSALHSDVEGTLAWTMQNVFRHELGLLTSVRLYVDGVVGETSWLTLAKDNGMLSGNVSSAPLDLERDLRSNTLFGSDDKGAMIDMVVLGTCENDMKTWSSKLLKVWDARPADRKFKLVCIAHNPVENEWFPLVAEWSRRGAIRFLLISDHVTYAFRAAFRALADSPDEAEKASFWEYIDFDTFYPIASFADRPEAQPRGNGKHDVLTHAGIQGTFDTYRRDYATLFGDLRRLLKEDPFVWGYLPLDKSADAAYQPDPKSPYPPFKLHLVGQGKFLYSPKLENIIQVHQNLDAKDFYDVVQSLDVIVPAFSEFGQYIDAQASSTVHTALECNIPILVTDAMRRSYRHINSDAVVLTRPHSIGEMDAIRLLRTKDLKHVNPPLDKGPPSYGLALKRFLEQGWKRPNEGFNTQKAAVWAANERVVRTILSQQ